MDQTVKAPWLRGAVDDHTWGSLGAVFSWPPRSYPCSFCMREFRSAQALGGHMNVHRRDRARLRQSLSPLSPSDQDDGLLQENPKLPASQSNSASKRSSFASSSIVIGGGAAAGISPTGFCKDGTTAVTFSNPVLAKDFALDGLKTTAKVQNMMGEKDVREDREKRENVMIRNSRTIEQYCDATLPLFVSSESEVSAEALGEMDLEVDFGIDLELRLGYSSDKCHNVLSL